MYEDVKQIAHDLSHTMLLTNAVIKRTKYNEILDVDDNDLVSCIYRAKSVTD